MYSYIQKPSKILLNCELFFFKKGIKPVWEHKDNRGGGKFLIRVKKEYADRTWEKLLMGVLSLENSSICGIVIISKRNEIGISIWTKELQSYGEK